MADETPTPEEGSQEQEQQETPATEAEQQEPTGDAAEAEKWKALSRKHERDNKRLATQIKEFEDRDKTEQQKNEEAKSAAEQRAVEAESRLLRFEVAAATSLPLELAARLQGSTKEELEEDAKRLLELVKPSQVDGDADAGKGEGAPGGDMNDLIRQQATR